MAKLVALTLLGVFMTVLVVISAEEKKCLYKKLFKKSFDACQDQISEENIEIIKKNEKYNDEIKNFLACVYTDSNVLSNSKLDIDAMKAKVDENVEDKEKAEKFKGLIQQCVNSAEGAESDPEAAGTFHKCMITAIRARNAEKESESS